MYFASEYVLTEDSKSRRAPQIEACTAGLPVQELEPDTNVVSMKFNSLVETHSTHAGDPIKCNHCEAILSKISTVSDESHLDGKRVWKCEFCNFENRIFVDNNEIPSNEEVTYILEPAPTRDNELSSLNTDSKYLIYCIDISGSMSITTQVNGNFELPTDKIRRENLLSATGERSIAPSYSKVKHISRLESVQLAITSNFEKLVKENQDKYVGLVTFNNSVNIIGDGSIEKLTISGDFLDNKDEIKKFAENTPEFKTINQNKKVLNEKLLNLEEGGATALGPALLYSILLASKKPGSQVILCTDGLANKGLGSLESTDEKEKIAFYEEVAKIASDNSVSVSILTIEGTNCKLGLLGDIADQTGGVVTIADPLKLKEEFSNVLESQIIATKVKATFILHKALYIRDHENINNRQSFTVKEIGNVTKNTEITLEFGLRDDAEIDTNIVKELPFQLKIEYYALDNCKALRVMTNLKKITDNKQLAEDATDRRILASHVTQTKSKLVQRGTISSFTDKMAYYIRKINPKKEDNFAEETFNMINNDLEGLRVRTTGYSSAMRSTMGVEINAYENLTDIESTRAYKYKNNSSSAFTKK